MKTAAYVPDIPTTLPLTRVVKDSEDGLSNEWRLREHWAPSVIWKNMNLIVPPVGRLLTLRLELYNSQSDQYTHWQHILPLPNINHPNDLVRAKRLFTC